METLLTQIAVNLLYDYEVAGSDKESIDTQVDDGGNGAVALPTTYRVLEVFMVLRTDEAVVQSNATLTFNNDTGANYDRQFVQGNNTTASAGGGVAGTGIGFNVPGASAAANNFSSTAQWIPGYSGTVAHKTLLDYSGWGDSTASAQVVSARAARYRSTSAITRLKVAPTTGGAKLKVGSRLIIFAR